MNANFEKRLLKAMNPRARRHALKHKAKFEHAKSHLTALCQEIAEDSARIQRAQSSILMTRGEGVCLACDVVEGTVKLATAATVAVALDGIDAIKAQIDKKAREGALAKRRVYYAAEAVARQKLRAQIEAARPAPLNPCPTAAELTEAYCRRHESEEWKIRFGTLMVDLEEHARRRYEISGNKFIGSKGGVKDWLLRECPLLAKHYSTCLRFRRKVQEELPEDYCT